MSSYALEATDGDGRRFPVHVFVQAVPWAKTPGIREQGPFLEITEDQRVFVPSTWEGIRVLTANESQVPMLIAYGGQLGETRVQPFGAVFSQVYPTWHRREQRPEVLLNLLEIMVHVRPDKFGPLLGVDFRVVPRL